jgi:diguanylate cyclase (GGDEF)-like protein
MKMLSEKFKDCSPISILGPVLIIAIALATANMMSTYKNIHKQKQATLWNLVQQDRNVGDTLFEAQQYLDDQQGNQVLRQNYEALLDQFPETIDSIEKDKTFQKVSGLSASVYATFEHVKSAKQMILESATIEKASLSQWVDRLNQMNIQLNEQVLDNVASTEREYSSKAFGTIIISAIILLALIFAFILYLGFLLVALRRERKRNLYMLAHDPLTGLSSRQCVMTTLQSRCKNKTPFALLMFDLNKFKAVNDTFGHHAGDQLLIHLADKFKQTLNNFGIVGRLGGDEFVWLAESDDPEVIQKQYALFLNELKDPCIINHKRLYIHISSGGGIAADYEYHSTQLLERVDEAMYQAKSLQIKEIFWENNAISTLLGSPNQYDLKPKNKQRRRDDLLVNS